MSAGQPDPGDDLRTDGDDIVHPPLRPRLEQLLVAGNHVRAALHRHRTPVRPAEVSLHRDDPGQGPRAEPIGLRPAQRRSHPAIRQSPSPIADVIRFYIARKVK